MKCEKVCYCPCWRRAFVTRDQILDLCKLCSLAEINRGTAVYDLRDILCAHLNVKVLYVSDPSTGGTSDRKILSGT